VASEISQAFGVAHGGAVASLLDSVVVPAIGGYDEPVGFAPPTSLFSTSARWGRGRCCRRAGHEKRAVVDLLSRRPTARRAAT
jgi:hypothetical protein